MKHSFVQITVGELFYIMLSVNILITFFVNNYAQIGIGIYCCFGLCSIIQN